MFNFDWFITLVVNFITWLAMLAVRLQEWFAQYFDFRIAGLVSLAIAVLLWLDDLGFAFAGWVVGLLPGMQDVDGLATFLLIDSPAVTWYSKAAVLFDLDGFSTMLSYIILTESIIFMLAFMRWLLGWLTAFK